MNSHGIKSKFSKYCFYKCCGGQSNPESFKEPIQFGCSSAFFGTKGTDICLISIAFSEGANGLSDFLLRLSILLTSEGTLLNSGGKSSSSLKSRGLPEFIQFYT